VKGVLCISCEYNLPYTGFKDSDNPVSQLFWGRIQIEGGTALIRFEKGSRYQAMLHELKYRRNRNVGSYLGRLLGHALSGTCFAGCDLLIPVPLHPKRLRKRGYNQSEVIAEGVSAVTGIPVHTNVLRRIRSEGSQTFKGRYDRFENVRGNFCLSANPPDLNGLTVLLLDDVVTTGATLEACCRILQEHFGCRIFVAAVSCA
jgi:ComF family protein